MVETYKDKETREKKRQRQKDRIEEYVQKFIEGEPQDEKIIHTWATLEIIENTLYYIRTGDNTKTYIPVCKKMPGGKYILNTWGFDEVSRAHIDDMCIREIERYPGRRANTIIRLPMQSNIGSPKIEIPYQNMDDAVGYFKGKLGGVEDKIAGITKDPDYNIAESKEELEEEAADLEEIIIIIRELAHQQGERDMRALLEDFIWTEHWLKEIVDGDDFYNPQDSTDGDTMKRTIKLQKGIKMFLETVDKKILALQEIEGQDKCRNPRR